MHLNLTELLLGSDNHGMEPNSIQIHLLSHPQIVMDTMCIGYSSEQASKILGNLVSRFGRFTTHQMMCIFHTNLSYIYDLENDGQKATRSNVLRDEVQDQQWYVQVLQEEVLPPHLFPCTRSIDAEAHVQAHHFRINNRVYIIHEKCVYKDDKGGADEDEYHSFYVRYTHNPNVELDKIQHDLNRAIRILGDCNRFA